MKTNTDKKILAYLQKNGQARPVQLIRHLQITGAALHRQLNKLLNKGLIVKAGKSPVVFYLLKQKVTDSRPIRFSENSKKIIDQHYAYLSPQGELLMGTAGFYQWFINSSQNNGLEVLAKEYCRIRQQYLPDKNLIDATKKIKQTFSKVYVNKLFYQDFYSLPQFGKTKLGLLVLHAKQSQNKVLVKQIAQLIKSQILKLIKRYDIQAVAFIPPSLPRKIQFLKELELELDLFLPKIKLVKVYQGEIIVPQKSLRKLNERVINARQTIMINQEFIENCQRILLIDDAVGSGATFNQAAKKLKQNFMIKKVYAFAPVGSLKGFPVIAGV